MSVEAKDIIIKLLIKDPTKRLGTKGEAEEIKMHPWFASINWNDLYNKKLEAQFKPKLKKMRWMWQISMKILLKKTPLIHS